MHVPNAWLCFLEVFTRDWLWGSRNGTHRPSSLLTTKIENTTKYRCRNNLAVIRFPSPPILRQKPPGTNWHSLMHPALPRGKKPFQRAVWMARRYFHFTLSKPILTSNKFRKPPCSNRSWNVTCFALAPFWMKSFAILTVKRAEESTCLRLQTSRGQDVRGILMMTRGKTSIVNLQQR